MRYKAEAHTDKGIKKSINQDALLIKQAKSRKTGHICMACLCDGMGGLSCGEVASSTFIDRMDKWFRHELPAALERENVTTQLDDDYTNKADYWNQIELQWNEIAQRTNIELAKFGKENGIKLGTTVAAVIVIDGVFMTMSVGDSRIYIIRKDELEQISHDHSYVQKEIDEGRMTIEEAAESEKKSVLLQCIGASNVVKPDFKRGRLNEGDCAFICSDGLWRKVLPSEIVQKAQNKKGLKELTELAKQRGETDNISGLIVSIK
ncbi:MAG: protein phosphatase 2C domain-containing protein [Pseudobutyrivibrio sp.]|nr:protein phosphatase 2C domain-containing protein [Pseudobutyrivibrio sp.]